MSEEQAKLEEALTLLQSASLQIETAKAVISQQLGGKPVSSEQIAQAKAKQLNKPSVEDDESKTIEGVFDGQKMVDGEGNSYPIPANYASKSKLVETQPLKLTITADGKFIYKQIVPIPQRTVIGPLTYENGQYSVLAEDKVYKILLASVTFYRAEVGDEVTILLPMDGEATWGAVDNIIPKVKA
jgi:hypothetical protein